MDLHFEADILQCRILVIEHACSVHSGSNIRSASIQSIIVSNKLRDELSDF